MAIQAVIQDRLFELVCWGGAQSLSVMSREMGLAEEAKMPAAESGGAAVVAPWCLDFRQWNQVNGPAVADPEKLDGEQTKAGASDCGNRGSQQAAKPVTVAVPRPIRRAKLAQAWRAV